MAQKLEPSKYFKQLYTSNLWMCPRCGSDIWGNLQLFKRNDDGTITIE